MEAWKTARNEIAEARAEHGIAAASSFNIPPHAEYKPKIGVKALAYGEAEKNCIDGFKIVNMNEKLVWVIDG